MLAGAAFAGVAAAGVFESTVATPPLARGARRVAPLPPMIYESSIRVVLEASRRFQQWVIGSRSLGYAKHNRAGPHLIV